jgi:hypothetical protein
VEHRDEGDADDVGQDASDVRVDPDAHGPGVQAQAQRQHGEAGHDEAGATVDETPPRHHRLHGHPDILAPFPTSREPCPRDHPHRRPA